MGDIGVSQASKTNNQKNKKLNTSGWKCVRGVAYIKKLIRQAIESADRAARKQPRQKIDPV